MDKDGFVADKLLLTTNPKNPIGYTDPGQITNLKFGTHSPWLQPWQAYLETMPATTFLEGTGVVWNTKSENPELIAQMLAENGIERTRFEMGWGGLNTDGELKENRAELCRDRLQALDKYGIRPTILLNAHQGASGPRETSKREITADAQAGDTKLKLADTSGLKADYSGLSDLTGYWAAEALITDINGNTVTLSKKPLPEDIDKGETVKVATLKYRPFSVPGSDDYRETMTRTREIYNRSPRHTR